MVERNALVAVVRRTDVEDNPRNFTHEIQPVLLKSNSAFGKVSKPDFENAARAIAEERYGKMSDEKWHRNLTGYYEMCAAHPCYAMGHSMIPDVMREAKAVIKSLGLELEG